MGEAAKPGKLAPSGLPSACVRACSGKRLGVLRGGWGEKKPSVNVPPEPDDYLAIGDVDR